MNKELNILITAASRRVAMIKGFRNALDTLPIEGKVVSSDINPLSPGLYISDTFHYAPMTTDPGYLDRLEEICCLEKIDAIIPTIDDELVLMGTARQRFEEIGIKIIISSPQTTSICNDKWMTYQYFSKHDIPTPLTWLPEELPPVSELNFPLFLKPRMGRGSIGTHRIRNSYELDFFLDYVDDPIVQQFLEGDEFTLDTLTDFDGNVIHVVPRQRLWVRSGVMDKGRTVMSRELIDLGIATAEKMNLIGPTNIQVKYHDGEPYVFEINPRFSGGIPLTISAGADFPLLICRMLMGEKLKPMIGEFEDGLVMMSFEDNIFRKVDTSDFDEIMKRIT